MSRQQYIGLSGAVLIITGVFCPLIDLPLIGTLNFFELNYFNELTRIPLALFAYTLLFSAIASILLCLFNSCKQLYYTGLLCAASISITLYELKLIEHKTKNDTIASFIMNITETKIDWHNLQWGWLVLILGIILIPFSAAMKSQQKKGIK